ncbi:dioxygenase [Halieaceae bacterium IMCC11814]|uniref:Dioxygenase n=2 Tax=Candidatus Marimicrobium litorale TaxID=2518991 RepID=A0ABT3T9Y3_9GAMM|nr:dioxygenase [Candidatus Marimicrobium litorale]
MTGVFAPVAEEITETDLRITGTLPVELNGRYFRNGANPRVRASSDWFLGEGMIHGVELKNGKATWYRNRYVRTPLLEKDEIVAEHIVVPGNSLANTHVISHAGKILALQEMQPPIEVTKNLETVGMYTFRGRLQSNMTAHPKICPVTGEMMFFGYGLLPPFLTYHRVSAEGELVQSEVVDVQAATMVHDFLITRNHVVFMDLPMLWDLEKLSGTDIPVSFDESYGARLGVMPRNGSNKDIKWFDIDPCYIYHTLNAYEIGSKIIVRAPRMVGYASVGMDHPPVPRLHEWTLNLDSQTCTEHQLDDLGVDFPTVPDAHIGRDHRYGYAAQLAQDGVPLVLGFHKYDFQTGSRSSHMLNNHRLGSEPSFVAAENAVSEDDGYLISYVYDPTEAKSELVIFNASQLSDDPLARIHLPARVPAGFHGSWIPDPA